MYHIDEFKLHVIIKGFTGKPGLRGDTGNTGPPGKKVCVFYLNCEGILIKGLIGGVGPNGDIGDTGLTGLKGITVRILLFRAVEYTCHLCIIGP